MRKPILQGFKTCAFFLTILVSIASFSAYAQNHFNSLFERTSLDASTIYHIAEDQHGFIWTFGSNGLSRYDGYELNYFRHQPNQLGSLPDGEITGLIADQLGRIWVATSQGLVRYDESKDVFISYNNKNSALIDANITAVTQGSNGTLLIADRDGLYRYVITTNTISRLDVKQFPSAEFKYIFEDGDRIWLGTSGNGVFAYSKRDGTIYSMAESNPWNMILPMNSLFMVAKFANSYWLGSDEGLFQIAPDDRVIDVFATANRLDLKKATIRDSLLFEQKLWLGSSSGILTISESGSIDDQFLLADIRDTDFSNYIYALHKDSRGTVWIGTYGGAYRKPPYDAKAPISLSQFLRNGQQSSIKDIWAIMPSENGDIWLAGMQDEIFHISAVNQTITPFAGLTNTSIWDLVIRDQVLWTATSDGIFEFEIQPDNQLLFKKKIYSGSLIDAILATEDTLWFWHDSLDVITLDVATKKVSTIEAPSLITTAQPIAEDSLGRIWFNSNMGIMVYEPSSELFDLPFQKDPEHPLHKAEIPALYTYGGHYYVVTAKKGLFKLDKLTLDIVERIPSNVVEIMSAVGLDNELWYAGTKTLHQVLLPQMINGEELPAQRLGDNEFYEWSTASSKDGALLFGGQHGITRIYPSYQNDQKSVRKMPPAPVLLDLKVFNKKVDPKRDGQTILKEPIFLASEINLENQENRFTIEFGVVNPLDVHQLQYRYRLVGYENDWINSETQRTAPYSGVSFGEYLFEVQARTLESEWSPSKSLKINIAPPLWLNNHALVFYTFFVMLLSIYLVKQYQAKKSTQLAIRESEERLKLTLWSSGDELWDWDIYGGQVHRSNVWGTLDFPQDDIRTNSSYEANIHPNDADRVKSALKEHLEARTEFYETTYRVKTFKGEWIWLLDRGKVVKRDQRNNPLRMTGTLKDIQHLKQAEEQLYLFKRSIETISEGVFITNAEFRFVSVNNAYCNYTGETREKALASYLFFHQYPDAFTQEIKKSLRQKGNWSGEVESIRSNGERFEMELNIDAIQGDDNKISHYVGVFSDITSRKNTEKELLKLANVDPLTDLPNRSFFQASHQNLVRKDVPHTLLCMDMDNFKKINDSLGHQTGDILIKQIARRVQRITGAVSTCYRLGGDEFSLLLENKVDVHTVTHFAQNILDTLSRPFVINKQEFVLSASLGIAFYPEDGNSPQELLKNADTAMYFAKNNGGNNYQFFSGEMNQNAVRQLQIENLIRQGLKENLFTVFYQPKVDITSGKMVSMEALVRFEHPQKGIVSPSQFIPLAEQTGQIIEIGEQVLRKACEDTKRWVNEGLFTGRVAVNISAKQFELPDLDDRIDRILRNVGLSPLHLECEITEGTLMENPEQALKLMQRLRERGVHLALDDFGTGYSSLAYLKRFPLNTLKIDKAFIDDIAESSVDRHMAAAIINIAHNLGLKVVAEGVEQEKQLSILRRYDCEMLQGYLYSKPLNAEKFEKLLRENQKLHQLIGHTKV